jgi:hypothetical protein
MNSWIEGRFIFLVKYEDLPKFLTDCKVEMGEDDRGQKADDLGLRIADCGMQKA